MPEISEVNMMYQTIKNGLGSRVISKITLPQRRRDDGEPSPPLEEDFRKYFKIEEQYIISNVANRGKRLALEFQSLKTCEKFTAVFALVKVPSLFGLRLTK